MYESRSFSSGIKICPVRASHKLLSFCEVRQFQLTNYDLVFYIPQPFLERRGDWTYCALAIRRLCQDDAGNYTVTVKNRHGEKSNHVRLSMKNPNEPEKFPGGIEPAFFRKPTSRQEGNLLHLECEIEALPKPEIAWYLGEQLITESDKYTFYRTIQPSNPNIHYVRLTIKVSC